MLLEDCCDYLATYRSQGGDSSWVVYEAVCEVDQDKDYLYVTSMDETFSSEAVTEASSVFLFRISGETAYGILLKGKFEEVSVTEEEGEVLGCWKVVLDQQAAFSVLAKLAMGNPEEVELTGVLPVTADKHTVEAALNKLNGEFLPTTSS